MTRLEARMLAAGHHLDDQVETALMRLGMKSSLLGASGMKYVRRWGMGDTVDGLDWAGYEGMRRFIVRPFLGVGKDRILATCEANNLEYVVDKTNFQPEVTLRNAIRHVVSNGTVCFLVYLFRSGTEHSTGVNQKSPSRSRE
jgi:tRNA(Ile)-lysidine synthase TilS/MesJ